MVARRKREEPRPAATAPEMSPRERLYRAWVRKDLQDLGRDRLLDPVGILNSVSRDPPHMQNIWIETLELLEPRDVDGVRRVTGYVRLYALTQKMAALAQLAGRLETRAEELLLRART